LTQRLNSHAARIKKELSSRESPGEAPDPLSVIAPLLRVNRVEVQEVCRFSSSWESVHEPQDPVSTQFHIITKGTCRLELPDGQNRILEAGSVVLIPHGGAHSLQSARGKGTHKTPIRVEYRGPIPLKTNTIGAGETELICGRLEFDGGAGGLAASALPEVIVSNVQSERSLERMHALVRMIEAELKLAQSGALTVASHLSSALFVLMMRSYFEGSASSSALLRLLSTPACAKAANALINKPAKPWTLDELAQTSHVSRATLVRAFQKASGMSPLAFLAELRLTLARQRLLGSKVPVAQVAGSVGFASESAFVRAFSRRYGVSPGKVRKT
jgi:AraC family transcriptional activator of mtrCDE